MACPSTLTKVETALFMVREALMSSYPDGEKPACVTLRGDGRAVDWQILDGLVAYPDALAAMKARALAIADGAATESVWLLEHPPLYTAGTSARETDLKGHANFPVFDAGRGGQYTYHGPGQRVVYVMLDLKERGRDIRCFVNHLEQWVIDTLAAFNIDAYRSEGRIGVWVARPDKGATREDKIAAIGVRVSKWVSFHGISLNVSPDLSHYDGIVPCGIADQDVTSFDDLGQIVSMAEIDSVLRRAFEPHFGQTVTVSQSEISQAEQITL